MIDQSKIDKNKIFSGRKRDLVMDSIALLVVVGFFAMTILIAITPRDNTDHDVLNILVGQLSAGFISVLAFFFGSVRKP